MLVKEFSGGDGRRWAGITCPPGSVLFEELNKTFSGIKRINPLGFQILKKETDAIY